MNSVINPFAVTVTGVRPGERIVGNVLKNNTKGSSMTFVDGLRPLSSWVNALKPHDFELVAALLSGTAMFANTSPALIKQWIVDNTYEDNGVNMHLHDFNVRVTNVVLGGEDINKYLTPEDIEEFAGLGPEPGGYWTLKSIYDRCLRNKVNNSDRDNGHGVLIFRPDLWRIQTGALSTYEGSYFDLDESLESSQPHHGILARDRVSRTIYILSGTPYAVITSSRSTSWNIKDAVAVVKSIFPDDGDTINSVVKELGKMPGGFFRSFMQKIIRTACTYVTHTVFNETTPDSRSWRGDVAVATAFALLLCHPGEFNERLGAFVTGAESAMKRAAVSCLEDSSISTPMTVARILVRALLCKQHRGSWFPTTNDVRESIEMLTSAWSRTQCFNYDLHGDLSILGNLHDEPLSPSWAVYSCLRECGSFESDITMSALIHLNGWTTSNQWTHTTHTTHTNTSMPRYPMSLLHAVDQHSNPDFVYCFDFEALSDLGYTSFPAVSRATWDLSSSYNPRRGDILPDAATTPYIALLNTVQHYVYHITHNTPRIARTRIEGETQNIIGDIPEAVLCGMVGHRLVTVKNGKKYLVSINPHDISTRVVMMNPRAKVAASDDVKSGTFTITNSIKIEAVRAFDKLLEHGFKLGAKAVAPYYWLRGGILYYRNGEYMYELDGSTRPWRDYLTPFITVPLVASLPLDISILERSLRYSDTGVISEWRSNLMTILSRLSISYLTSLKSTIVFSITNNNSIVFPSVDKDGEGTKYVAKFSDLVVVSALSEIATVVPFALTRTGSRSFKIGFLPMLNTIADFVDEIIASRTIETMSASRTDDRRSWDLIQGDSREKFTHQAYMIERLATSGRMAIICSDVGTGKTLTMLEDVCRNIAENTMPPYFFYFTVRGGEQTAVTEAQRYGLKTTIVDPRIGSRKSKVANIILAPYVMNVIVYDQARLHGLDQALIDRAAEAFVIFDEFDTVVNPTKKTSIALDVARRAQRVVCCSATPVKDRHLEYLIPWLSQLVPFNVTYSNIWSAMAGLITGIVDLGITVIKRRIEAPLTQKEEVDAAIFSSHPVRIPPRDFRALVNIYYNACFREQIRQTLEYAKTQCVFLVVGRKSQLFAARDALMSAGIRAEEIAIVGLEGGQTTFLADDVSEIRIIITTIYYTRSYTATRATVMIKGVFFVSEATQIQTLGRIRRTTQRSKEVTEVIVHAGILTLVLERYDRERSMIDAARSVSAVVGGDLLGATKDLDGT